jgi:hypothetical protein
LDQDAGRITRSHRQWLGMGLFVRSHCVLEMISSAASIPLRHSHTRWYTVSLSCPQNGHVTNTGYPALACLVVVHQLPTAILRRAVACPSSPWATRCLMRFLRIDKSMPESKPDSERWSACKVRIVILVKCSKFEALMEFEEVRITIVELPNVI